MKKLLAIGLVFAGQMSLIASVSGSQKQFNLEESLAESKKYDALKSSISGLGCSPAKSGLIYSFFESLWYGPTPKIACTSDICTLHTNNDQNFSRLGYTMQELPLFWPKLKNPAGQLQNILNTIHLMGQVIQFKAELEGLQARVTEQNDHQQQANCSKQQAIDVSANIKTNMEATDITSPRCNNQGEMQGTDLPESFKKLVSDFKNPFRGRPDESVFNNQVQKRNKEKLLLAAANFNLNNKIIEDTNNCNQIFQPKTIVNKDKTEVLKTLQVRWDYTAKKVVPYSSLSDSAR